MKHLTFSISICSSTKINNIICSQGFVKSFKDFTLTFKNFILIIGFWIILLLYCCNLHFCFRNHKTCQQLRSICLHTMGFGHLSCLKAFTDRVRTCCCFFLVELISPNWKHQKFSLWCFYLMQKHKTIVLILLGYFFRDCCF